MQAEREFHDFELALQAPYDPIEVVIYGCTGLATWQGAGEGYAVLPLFTLDDPDVLRIELAAVDMWGDFSRIFALVPGQQLPFLADAFLREVFCDEIYEQVNA